MSYVTVWLEMEPDSRRGLLSCWFCCPVCLTVVHEWLCRQGAHADVGRIPPGIGDLGNAQWVINPSQCKWTVVVSTHEVVVHCGEQTGLHVLLSHHHPPPPAPPLMCQCWSAGRTPLIALSMATLYPAPISSPPESVIQFQNTSILRCLQRLVLVWPSFVSFCPRLRSLRRDSSCRSCTNVLGSVPLMFVIPTAFLFLFFLNYFQLRGRMHLRTRPLTSLHVETFWVCFPKTIVFTQANKSVSGRFCHGLKHRAGNKLHIHVCDNKLMDANVRSPSPTPPTWLLSLTTIAKCLPIHKCVLYLCLKRNSPLKKNAKFAFSSFAFEVLSPHLAVKCFFYLQGLNLSTFESEWVRSVKGQTGVFVAVFII